MCLCAGIGLPLEETKTSLRRTDEGVVLVGVGKYVSGKSEQRGGIGDCGNTSLERANKGVGLAAAGIRHWNERT